MLFSIQNENLNIQVNDYGAELWSIYDKTTKTEHLWQGEASIWPRRAPILFPICGDFAKGSYTVNGTEYTMPLHGIARDFVHELVEQTKNSLRFRLVDETKTHKQYPFAFQFDSIFTLNGATLEHSFEITNTGSEILPFATGYHTGYRTFQKPGETLEDYELRFDTAEPDIKIFDDARISSGKSSLLSADGKVLKLTSGLFTEAIKILSKKSDSVTLINTKTGAGVSINSKYAPEMTLWCSVDETPFICIEPWWGSKENDSNYGEFINKPNMQLLESGKTFRCEKKITILK